MISTIFQGNSGDWVFATDTKGKKRLVVERRQYIVAATKIRNRMRIWLGEWFADTRIGVPYIQKIFARGASPALVRRVFTDIIMSMAPIITEVTKLDLKYVAEREVEIYFEARADTGQVITGGFSGSPFILRDSQE